MTEPVHLSTEYILVIDTDSPAFGFAKDLCAYCTGYESEDSKSLAMANQYFLDLGLEDPKSDYGRILFEKSIFYDAIADKRDDEDKYSPCTVMLNKRYGCDDAGNYQLLDEKNFDQFSQPAPLSVGIFFYIEPTKEQVALIRQRAMQFFKNVWQEKKVVVEGLRLIVQTKYGEERVLD